MRPAVSVVIPTYNGAAYIKEALASVFAQTLPPAEVIVVDDCSKDLTADMVQRVAASAPLPVRLIRQARNSGSPAHPLNVGIEAARGDLIAVLDQDDTFLPNKLAEQAAVLSADDRLVCVFGDVECCGKRSFTAPKPDIAARLQRLGVPNDKSWRLDGKDVLRLLLLHGMFVLGYPGFIFRRRAWLEREIDESFVIGSDYDFLCWLCSQGPAAYVPAVHYCRKEHEDNLSRRTLTMDMEVFRVRRHYAATVPGLFEDQSFAEELRKVFDFFAYTLREGGRYALAFRAYRAAAQLFGWDAHTVAAMLKLAPHCLLRSLTGRPPRHLKYSGAPDEV